MIRWLFRPGVIFGSFLVALCLLAITLGALWGTRPEPQASAPATAVLNVIPAPSPTPTLPTPTPVFTPTPEQPVPPAPEPGVIGIGAYVQISGTGGDGLRLRTEPSLNSQVRLLGAEAEVFQVSEGPQESDGYVWWYLVGPYDPSRRGWAVSNFLAVVQGP